MLTTFYFKVHHPRRLRRFDIKDSGHLFFDFIKKSNEDIKGCYFNDEENERLFKQAVESYLVINNLIYTILKRHPEIRVCFHISGSAMRQTEKYRVQAFFDSFHMLLDTGQVELISGPQYHSLAGLFEDPDKHEFVREIKIHMERTKHFFGVTPKCFVNSDMIYNDSIANAVAKLGFNAILTEGLPEDPHLHKLCETHNGSMRVLLRDYELSDLLIHYSQNHLRSRVFLDKLQNLEGDIALIGMDYAPFSRLLRESEGFKKFFLELMGRFPNRGIETVTPREALKRLSPAGSLSVPQGRERSWVSSKNLKVFLGDEWQKNGFDLLQLAEQAIRRPKTKEVFRDIFGNLLTTDNFTNISPKKRDLSAVSSFHRIIQDFTAKASINYFHINKKQTKLRVLTIGPEMRELPRSLGRIAVDLYMDGGGLGEVHSTIFKKGFESDKYMFFAGFPDLRRNHNKSHTIDVSFTKSRHIFMATHAEFYNLGQLYRVPNEKVADMSLIFQKEMIEAIEHVKPDIVHFHDWPCGLLPGYVKYLNDGLKHPIKVISTIHNIHSREVNRSHIINRGIPFDQIADKLYREGAEKDWVALLPSMIFGSDFINTVSFSYLQELLNGWHGLDGRVAEQLRHKNNAHCAFGILNAPDDSFNPLLDKTLKANFDADSTQLLQAKQKNKLYLQEKLGLMQDPNAILAFWPSRMDRHQKGIDLVFDRLEAMVRRWRHQNLQFAFVADEVGTGWDCSTILDRIRYDNNIHDSVGVHMYDKALSRIGYAAADIVLVPSRYAPCELPQMVGPKYGAFPVARNTGGIHDTVSDLDTNNGRGNGFLFNDYTPEGLWWAMSNAMDFFSLPMGAVDLNRRRIMKEARKHNPDNTVSKYFMMYDLLGDEKRYQSYLEDEDVRREWQEKFYRF